MALQETESLFLCWDEAPDTTGCRLVASDAKNGVGFVLSSRFFKACIFQRMCREFGVLLCEVAGVKILILNVHLPDDSTLRDRGPLLPQVLSSIDEVLAKLWLDGGWQHILMMGDFNTMHPELVVLPPPSRSRLSVVTCRVQLMCFSCAKSGISTGTRL